MKSSVFSCQFSVDDLSTVRTAFARASYGTLEH